MTQQNNSRANLFGQKTYAPHRVYKNSRRGPPRYLKIGRDKGESGRERSRYWRHARRLNIGPRLEGRYGGAIGSSALLVYNALLFKFHRESDGRCDPGYGAIARFTGLGRSTVHEALRELEARGMVEHDRRVYEKETAPGSRFELAQDTNVYRLLRPERWKNYNATGVDAPPPEAGTTGEHERVLALRDELKAARARGASVKEIVALCRRADADAVDLFTADALERAQARRRPES